MRRARDNQKKPTRVPLALLQLCGHVRGCAPHDACVVNYNSADLATNTCPMKTMTTIKRSILRNVVGRNLVQEHNLACGAVGEEVHAQIRLTQCTVREDRPRPRAQQELDHLGVRRRLKLNEPASQRPACWQFARRNGTGRDELEVLEQ